MTQLGAEMKAFRQGAQAMPSHQVYFVGGAEGQLRDTDWQVWVMGQGTED